MQVGFNYLNNYNLNQNNKRSIQCKSGTSYLNINRNSSNSLSFEKGILSSFLPQKKVFINEENLYGFVGGQIATEVCKNTKKSLIKLAKKHGVTFELMHDFNVYGSDVLCVIAKKTNFKGASEKYVSSATGKAQSQNKLSLLTGKDTLDTAERAIKDLNINIANGTIEYNNGRL